MLKTIVEVFQKLPQLPCSPHVQREGAVRQHCEGLGLLLMSFVGWRREDGVIQEEEERKKGGEDKK